MQERNWVMGSEYEDNLPPARKIWIQIELTVISTVVAYSNILVLLKRNS
jgi:high-affinity nickel permease